MKAPGTFHGCLNIWLYQKETGVNEFRKRGKLYTVCMHSAMVPRVAKYFSVSILERVKGTEFSHMASMLHTGTAGWPSGGRILLSLARRVFNPFFDKMFSKLRVTLKEDTEEFKKKNLSLF